MGTCELVVSSSGEEETCTLELVVDTCERVVSSSGVGIYTLGWVVGSAP